MSSKVNTIINCLSTQLNSKINSKEGDFLDAKIRIKQLMKKKNISEYRLAKLSGLSQSTISNIFNRNTAPTIPTIEAICNGLGISIAQFFADEDNESPVYLSSAQKDFFDEWLSLTAEQKSVVEKLVQSYKVENK